MSITKKGYLTKTMAFVLSLILLTASVPSQAFAQPIDNAPASITNIYGEIQGDHGWTDLVATIQGTGFTYNNIGVEVVDVIYDGDEDLDFYTWIANISNTNANFRLELPRIFDPLEIVLRVWLNGQSTDYTIIYNLPDEEVTVPTTPTAPVPITNFYGEVQGDHGWTDLIAVVDGVGIGPENLAIEVINVINNGNEYEDLDFSAWEYDDTYNNGVAFKLELPRMHDLTVVLRVWFNGQPTNFTTTIYVE